MFLPDLFEPITFQKSVFPCIWQSTKNAIALCLFTPVRFAFLRLKAANNVQFKKLLFFIRKFGKNLIVPPLCYAGLQPEVAKRMATAVRREALGCKS
jgi:hypothetical protein